MLEMSSETRSEMSLEIDQRIEDIWQYNYSPPSNKGVRLGVAIPNARRATALPIGLLGAAFMLCPLREAGVVGVPGKNSGWTGGALGIDCSPVVPSPISTSASSDG